jgi:hypothetical protein
MLNGSIANLFVTRKSLIARNSGSPFLLRIPTRMTGLVEEDANKKAGAGKAPALAPNKKAGAGKAPAWARRIFSPQLAARGSVNYFCTFA